MVKFEIEESLNYRGGSHYCFVYAQNVDEVVEELKDAWFATGIHRHGGELFLNVYLKNSGNKEVLLSCGHCSVDKNGDLYSSFDFPFDGRDRSVWYSLGLFLEDYEGDSFEEVVEQFFELDSPDRVLGSYLYRLDQIHNGAPALNNDEYGNRVLANVLNFSKQHNKMYEMYSWLRSKEGKDYLLGNSNFEFTAKAMQNAIDKTEITDVESLVKTHKKDFDTHLYLPSN